MVLKAVLFDLGETLLNYGRVDVDGLFREGARLSYAYLQREMADDGRLGDFGRYYRRYIWSIK